MYVHAYIYIYIYVCTYIYVCIHICVYIREKRALVKTASKSYRKNPTNTNARKIEKAQYQFAGIYLKEQAECIQIQIDKIRDSVEDRQSRVAWQKINEVEGRAQPKQN